MTKLSDTTQRVIIVSSASTAISSQSKADLEGLAQMLESYKKISTSGVSQTVAGAYAIFDPTHHFFDSLLNQVKAESGVLSLASSLILQDNDTKILLFLDHDEFQRYHAVYTQGLAETHVRLMSEANVVAEELLYLKSLGSKLFPV